MTTNEVIRLTLTLDYKPVCLAQGRLDALKLVAFGVYDGFTHVIQCRPIVSQVIA